MRSVALFASRIGYTAMAHIFTHIRTIRSENVIRSKNVWTTNLRSVATLGVSRGVDAACATVVAAIIQCVRTGVHTRKLVDVWPRFSTGRALPLHTNTNTTQVNTSGRSCSKNNDVLACVP